LLKNQKRKTENESFPLCCQEEECDFSGKNASKERDEGVRSAD
jgi:hypothetical protein